MIICFNGHSMCEQCFNEIRSSARPVCPTCSEGLLPSPIINRDVLSLIEAVYESMAAIPVIKGTPPPFQT